MSCFYAAKMLGASSLNNNNHNKYMNSMKQLVCLCAMGCVAMSATAQVIVHDTWADGSRTEQNLPTESAWLGSHAGILASTPGSMTFTPNLTSSRAAITYFAPVGSPIVVPDGSRLTVTLRFSMTGITDNDGSNMRLGLFDYDGGTRVTTDPLGTAGLNGANVTGYATFTYMDTAFNTTRYVLDLKDRNVIATTDLLGSGSAYDATRLGGIRADDGMGMSDNVDYVMTFAVERDGSTANVLNTLTGPGLNLSASGSDTVDPYFSFDAFAFRNSRADQSAATYTFKEFKVELAAVPEPSSLSLLGLFGLLLAVKRTRS
jgi:hypothetical protein